MFEMMDFVLKMMDFALEMLDSDLINGRIDDQRKQLKAVRLYEITHDF